MNWTKMSAIAEIVSSVAILVTVVYLAAQTRQIAVQTQQNTVAIQSSVRQDMLALDVQWLLERTNNVNRGFLWCKPDLTDLEKSAIHNEMIALVRMREAQWLQYQDGALDEATWRSYRGALAANLSTPRAREWWNRMRTVFHGAFSEDIDAFLATIPLRQQCENDAID